jgi:membrane protein YqaA with SNARE-associated domain
VKPAAESAAGKRKGWVRRLYDWVLHWADRPSGPTALGVLSFAEASFFPIPPDPLLMALCLGAIKKSLRFAAITTAASVFGGIAGYLIGAGAWHVLGDFFFNYVPGVTREGFLHFQDIYDQNSFIAVFFAGLTPLPYKLFTLSAGVATINFPMFFLASVLSRGLRFFAEAGLIYWKGPSISRFIDRYFNLLAWLFGILLVLGFVAVKYLL